MLLPLLLLLLLLLLPLLLLLVLSSLLLPLRLLLHRFSSVPSDQVPVNKLPLLLKHSTANRLLVNHLAAALREMGMLDEEDVSEEEIVGTNSRLFRGISGTSYNDMVPLLRGELGALREQGAISSKCCRDLQSELTGLGAGPALNMAACQFVIVLQAFVLGRVRSSWRLPATPVLQTWVEDAFASARRRGPRMSSDAL